MSSVRVVLMVGLPGSGKSTWLREQNAVALSSDEIRRLLTDDETNQGVNPAVFATVRYLLRWRLKIGLPVTYIDATSLTRKERKSYIRLAQEYDATVEAVFFDVPIEICKQRNRSRLRIVPDEAIDYLASKLQPPTLSEGLSSVLVIGRDGLSTAQAAVPLLLL